MAAARVCRPSRRLLLTVQSQCRLVALRSEKRRRPGHASAATPRHDNRGCRADFRAGRASYIHHERLCAANPDLDRDHDSADIAATDSGARPAAACSRPALCPRASLTDERPGRRLRRYGVAWGILEPVMKQADVGVGRRDLELCGALGHSNGTFDFCCCKSYGTCGGASVSVESPGLHHKVPPCHLGQAYPRANTLIRPHPGDSYTAVCA